MNSLYKRLVDIINSNKEKFLTLINADNRENLNISGEEVLNYLEFFPNEKALKYPIVGTTIITEGDILTILKIIHDIADYEGIYTIFINADNMGTNAYLIKKANEICQQLKINVELKIDYSRNYNAYLTSLVTIIGSQIFVETASLDFDNANKIIT